MICLYNKNETNFTYNGLGTLEPTECSFFPSINGVWSLKMTLPIDPEGKSNLIENDKIIKVTGIDCIEEQTSDYQLFRIYDFRKEQNYVYVNALPVGLDARFDTYVRSLKLYDKTATTALSDINNLSNKYTVTGSGYDSSYRSTEFENANIISILNGEDSFVTTWDGEICYDNYNLKVNHRLGVNATPLDVRYGKNIMGMSYDLDASNVITRLYPKAKSGEFLNAIADYKIGNNQYVDAENASDYPIPHIYYADTPFSLVQLSNDGSEEYTKSHELYEAIKLLTANWLHDALLNDSVYDGLLNEIELDWILNNYAATLAKDGFIGIAEHIARNIWTNDYHNILSETVRNLIYNAIKAGFDDALKNDQSQFYIGSSDKDWIQGSGGPFYSYEWDTTGNYKLTAPSGEYVWAYTSGWRQINDQGFATGLVDSATWKWYKKKVNGVTIKRYGNKKKNRYLHDQWWKINNVWYWFNSNGEGKKGAWLNNTYNEYFDEAEIEYSTSDRTIYEMLLPVCIDGEADLFELLYRQMTRYCYYLYETDKLAFPTIKLEINMVDLSRTEEYKDFEALERIHLGNEVRVYNPRLMPEPSTVRVIGLTYDVLKKCNTEIKIGLTESSVVNLLDSIGKKDSGIKYVAGDGITIEGDTISVVPPSTPYMTDFFVNGESVVRNHVGYLDLDALGIDESVHVLFGTEEPTSDDGEDNDIYVKLKDVDIPYTSQVTMTFDSAETWINAGITRNEDDSYNIRITGRPSPDHEYVSYKIEGLEEGERYRFEYDYKVVNGVAYRYPNITNGIIYLDEPNHYNSPSFVGDIDTAGWYEEYKIQRNDHDENLHHYSNDFDASANTMYFEFITSDMQDGTYSEVQVSDLTVTHITYEIEKVFFKHEGEWLKAGVTANPSEEATDALTKIKINGVVYSLSGSGGASALSDLTDVDLNNLSNGQILKYNSTTQKWENEEESGGGGAISDLTDVELTNLADGEILKYDATAQKWINAVESGGGGGITQKYHANWTTASSSTSGTALTNNMTLPSGKYIVIAHTPPTSATQAVLNSDFQFALLVNGALDVSTLAIFNRSYGIGAWLLDLSQESTVALCVAQSNSITWVSQYLDRGGIDAINLSRQSSVSYSDDEQLIGTWYGNALYQKNVATGGSVPSGATLVNRMAFVGKDVIQYTK